MKKKQITSGWCNGPLHDHCPHKMRSEMTTPKGVFLRELQCACPCHQKDAQDVDAD